MIRGFYFFIMSPSISTINFDEAVFLEASGANLVLVDRGHSGKVVFLFEKNTVTLKLEEKFRTGQRQVDSVRYASAARYLASLAKGVGKGNPRIPKNQE